MTDVVLGGGAFVGLLVYATFAVASICFFDGLVVGRRGRRKDKRILLLSQLALTIGSVALWVFWLVWITVTTATFTAGANDAQSGVACILGGGVALMVALVLTWEPDVPVGFGLLWPLLLLAPFVWLGFVVARAPAWCGTTLGSAVSRSVLGDKVSSARIAERERRIVELEREAGIDGEFWQ